MVITDNFVLSSVAAAITATQTVGIQVNSAVAPYHNIPNPATSTNGISYLVLCDNLQAPTVFEIISYTGYTLAGPIFTLTGVTRALGNTTAVAWALNAPIYMPALNLIDESVLWAPDSSGNISYLGGMVGIGKAPTVELDIEGNSNVSGNAGVGGTLLVSGTATMADVNAAALAASGEVSGATAVITGIANIGGLATLAQLMLGTKSVPFSTFRLGTWTPTLLGSSTPGVGVYGSQTGIYITIGKFVYLQFYIAVNSWSTQPSGDIILSGYPAVGTLADFAGSMQQLAGVNLFNGFTANTVGTPITTVIQNAVLMAPVTIAEPTNQGLKFRITVHSNNQSLSSVQTQATTATRFLSPTDFIYNGTSGETLLLSGNILFESQTEYTT